MNMMQTLPASEARPHFYNLNTTPPCSPHDDRVRVAVFGSFIGGYHVLRELLGPELRRSVVVTGVATDDPTQPYTHPNVRLWRYPHTRDDELLVPRVAEARGFVPFTGRVNTEAFFEIFVHDWKPDLCLMATFGQKIPRRLFAFPRLGFLNFHHSDEVWPSYPGPDPITQMVRDGKTHLVLTMHEVNEVLDGGRFVAHSHRVPIPPAIDPINMHRITWPQMGPFIRQQVDAVLHTEARPVSMH